MTWRSNQFQQFDAETFLARKLKEHGIQSAFVGATDPDKRKVLFRNAIISANLECKVIEKNLQGKSETYLEFFERIYDEPFGKTYT